MPPAEFSLMKYLSRCHGKSSHNNEGKNDRMCKSTVAQEVLGFVQPEICEEIYIGDALSQSACHHGFATEYLSTDRFADAGAKNYMR